MGAAAARVLQLQSVPGPRRKIRTDGDGGGSVERSLPARRGTCTSVRASGPMHDVARRTPLVSSSGADARRTPLLFLDIDGVLNRTATAPQIAMEQDKVDRLRAVLHASGADVVLSTYWRAFDEYIGYTLGRMGAQGERVVGRTPGDPHLMDSVKHDNAVKTTRIKEIAAYMEERFGPEGPGWPRFAIVDDKVVVPDGHAWAARFVKTEPEVGLTDGHVERLVAALAIETDEVGAEVAESAVST